MKTHVIIYATLFTLIIFLTIRQVGISDELEKVRVEKSYMEMQISGQIETLRAIQHRREIEDSLRQIKSPQYEENLRLIRSATDADLKRLIESSADTARFRLLFP